MDLSLERAADKISLKEQTSLLVFLDHCFTSMEVDLIRNQIQRLVSVCTCTPLCHCASN
jgi:intron-binding protein aquarius